MRQNNSNTGRMVSMCVLCKRDVDVGEVGPDITLCRQCEYAGCLRR